MLRVGGFPGGAHAAVGGCAVHRFEVEVWGIVRVWVVLIDSLVF